MKKALYGRKQAPRTWYSRIEAYFLKVGFSNVLMSTHCLLSLKMKGKCLLYVCILMTLYLLETVKSCFYEFKTYMIDEFEMSDLGVMHYFLGIEVVNGGDGIFLSMQKLLLSLT